MGKARNSNSCSVLLNAKMIFGFALKIKTQTGRFRHTSVYLAGSFQKISLKAWLKPAKIFF